MATSPLPPTTVAVLDSTGQFTLPWRRWFQALQTAVGGVGPEGPPGTDGKDGKDGASDDVAAVLAFSQLDTGMQLSAGPGIILRPPLLTQGAGIISAQMFGTGLDGLDGEDGQTVPGAAGARGAAGASGFPIPGTDGDPGDDGQPIPGPRGLQGLQGVSLPGLDGADGDDSYMIDVGAQTIARTPFVPTVSFATLGDLSVVYTTQLGAYAKVGPLVVFWYNLAFTPTYTTAAGNFQISQPPVVPSDGAVWAWPISQLASPAWPATRTAIIARLQASGVIVLSGLGTTAGAANFQTTQITSGALVSLNFSGYYF